MTHPVELFEKTLNDKRIAYTSLTEFYVQCGFGKNSYQTRWTFVGDLPKAVAYYNAINIGRGYKKRLRMHDVTLARATS